MDEQQQPVKSKRGGKRPGAGRKPSYTIVDSRENKRKPKPIIDLKIVESCRRIGATIEDLAAEFGMPKRTLVDAIDRNPKLKEVFETAATRGKLSLRRRLWQLAFDKEFNEKTTLAACIFLNKNENGMSDRGYMELAGKDGKPIEVADVSAVRERITGRIAGLAAKLAPRETPE